MIQMNISKKLPLTIPKATIIKDGRLASLPFSTHILILLMNIAIVCHMDAHTGRTLLNVRRTNSVKQKTQTSALS